MPAGIEAGTSPPDSTRPEIPAATLIVFRQSPTPGAPPEILMTVRSSALAFAGGAAVFPGGRVDPADRDLAATLARDGEATRADADELAHRIAAIRETLEETGLALGFDGDVDVAGAARARAILAEGGSLDTVMAETGWRLATEQLVPFARWCPRGISHHRIFDTRFYLSDLGSGRVELAADASETSALFWISAAEALERARSGALQLIFPTRRNLERLAQFASFAEAREHARATPIRQIIPAVVDDAQGRHLVIPEGLGYPVTRESLDSAMRG